MTLYHAIEILLVAAIVGSCAVAVGRHFLPGVREWLHPTPRASDGSTAAACGNGGCNGCSSGNKTIPH